MARSMETLYTLNDTRDYHISGITTLGWELTVCNALEEQNSPCRSILEKKDTFGNLLYDFLETIIPMKSIRAIAEVGGGYGYLMRDFLLKNAALKASLIDISGLLLNRQRETLAGGDVEFIQKDFFEIDAPLLSGYDLVLMNEIVGDFITVCGISPEIFIGPYDGPDQVIRSLRRVYAEYGLPVPERPFTANLGALEALERLCSAGIKYIYLSEHSCEATVPADMKGLIPAHAAGEPERIRLMGHDEYTIQFSHLERIAKKFNYRVCRGQYRRIMPFEYSDRLNFILTSHSQKDEHEIIRQFVEDLFKYEFLILTRDDL